MLDLVVCVFGCDTIEKYKAEILKIEETWGAKALEYSTSVKVLFFLGEETTDLSGDQYIHLAGVKNDYLSASYKQFLGLKYIYDNFPCKFVFVCGTDTYVNIPLLVNYVNLFNSSAALYIGGHGTDSCVGTKKVYFHSGGAGVLLSYASQTALYPQLETAVEDWLAICKTNKTDECLYTACDVALAYYVQQPSVGAVVFKQGGSVFMGCNYCGLAYGYYPCHAGCIDLDRLISCHSMSLVDFDNFTQILVKNNWYVPLTMI
jgi:Fringe-like